MNKLDLDDADRFKAINDISTINNIDSNVINQSFINKKQIVTKRKFNKKI